MNDSLISAREERLRAEKAAKEAEQNKSFEEDVEEAQKKKGVSKWLAMRKAKKEEVKRRKESKAKEYAEKEVEAKVEAYESQKKKRIENIRTQKPRAERAKERLSKAGKSIGGALMNEGKEFGTFGGTTTKKSKSPQKKWGSGFQEMLSDTGNNKSFGGMTGFNSNGQGFKMMLGMKAPTRSKRRKKRKR